MVIFPLLGAGPARSGDIRRGPVPIIDRFQVGRGWSTTMTGLRSAVFPNNRRPACGEAGCWQCRRAWQPDPRRHTAVRITAHFPYSPYRCLINQDQIFGSPVMPLLPADPSLRADDLEHRAMQAWGELRSASTSKAEHGPGSPNGRAGIIRTWSDRTPRAGVSKHTLQRGPSVQQPPG
jgi:hypothetical protein